jgi:alkylation response protein AidB-like acyl-CoA dehydrogenase
MSDLDEIQRRLAEGAARHDLAATFPHDHFAPLRDRGLLAMTVGLDAGGSGAGLVRAREVIAAVARGDPSTALVLTMQLIQTRAVSQADSRWPAELRRRVLLRAVRDGALCNALRVEPDLATPASGGLPATPVAAGRPRAGASRPGGERRPRAVARRISSCEEFIWRRPWP